ncbi:MAG: dephospho-CoA kinase [Myxococcaceae bacterium]|nr:dephospho-CoA kinase [Myxococcaceae bacterium]
MPTRLIGLTGSIATGKSTVARMLVERGAALLDADQIAREVVTRGQSALAEIAARFPGVILPDGSLDRQALGERIFSNPAERQALNAITHPRIQAEVIARTLALTGQGVPVVIYDAALLIENKLHEALEGVILVTAPPGVQRQRLIARDGLTVEQAEARIASQLPQEEKLKFATWVIDNGGTLEATRLQVDALWEKLRSGP